VRLVVAGRTDAGVHALGQVASFDCAAAPARDLRGALNGITANDVVVNGASVVADGFNARHDARSRVYCYRVHASPLPSPFERGLALFWPHRVDFEVLQACAAAISGTHDFTAFTRKDTKHVRFERRILRSEWIANGSIFEYWIEADAFMRSMVRILVGTMLDVGGGRRGLAEFRALLEGAPREHAGDTARPHGLYLAEVRY
jgi:tRNA pseudouridine38-40 synthase